MKRRNIAQVGRIWWVAALAAAVASATGCGTGSSDSGQSTQVDSGRSAQALSAGAQYGAGSTIQAEAFSSKSTPNPLLENNTTTIGFFDAGTWFCYSGVDMTGVTGMDMSIAAPNAGTVFSVRLDSSTGTEIGRYTNSTPTANWSTWTTRAVSLAATSGVHSLCMRGESGYGILNLDWLKLNGTATAVTYKAGDTIQAEALTSKSTPNPQLESNDTTLGFFDAGTWFCFDGVDLTGVTSLDLQMAAVNTGGVFSVRVDSSTGTEIGRYTVSSATGGWQTYTTRSMPVKATSGAHALCLRGESGGGILNLDWLKLSTGSVSPTQRSDIVGKVTVGYQGWFNAAGDGSGIQPPWWHWTADRNTPTPSNYGIKSWPDMADYAKTYATGFPNLGSGKPATLYSNWDASTVDTHVRWMRDNNIDTIALQRFGDFRGTNEARNVVARNLRTAAEAYGRKFYIMYDITGWDTFQADLKSDWTTHIVNEMHLTDSSAYAMQNGKPVVCIWGLGYSGHPGTLDQTIDIINWFHNQGLYVIGGAGNDWRNPDGKGWSKVGYTQAFDLLDAISPWMVGVIGDAAGSDNNRKNYNEGDVAYLHARGKHYQPSVLPGDLQLGQRKHGDFMWHQFYNMIQIGSDGIYISMYDEYNEGNQIAKTAATAADKPTGSSFATLDEDGTQCSSDYYLRLTGDGGRMLKKEIALTPVRPTSPR
jgi:hypothetical protein